MPRHFRALEIRTLRTAIYHVDAEAVERIAELEAELAAVNAAAIDSGCELSAARAEAARAREELAAAAQAGKGAGLAHQLQAQLQVGDGHRLWAST